MRNVVKSERTKVLVMNGMEEKRMAADKIGIGMPIFEKLKILSDAAKYDVSCTSSGVDRQGDGTGIGNCHAAGICHSFAADGRCVSLLKILFTNECIFDCKYCVNRSSNDVERTSFTPDEVCTLTIEFYRRNYIEGLFLSSGILKSPNYTMELIYATLYKLRHTYHFQGYIHVKAIPGTDAELIRRIGFLADRMSVNLELPTAESLRLLAPHKTRKNILAPMRLVQNAMAENKQEVALYRNAPHFVPAGQSTQMIIGATPENDYQILNVAESLYQKFGLKRVFYSAYVSVNKDAALPVKYQEGAGGGPPLLREHRLYQADWLLRFYQFPVEVNKAGYEMLLRVPGVGVKSALRIVKARRMGNVKFEDLKRMGVVLKRAVYFLTCNGRMMYPSVKIDEDYITRNLLNVGERLPDSVTGLSYRQLSLFDDQNFTPRTLQNIVAG